MTSYICLKDLYKLWNRGGYGNPCWFGLSESVRNLGGKCLPDRKPAPKDRKSFFVELPAKPCYYPSTGQTSKLLTETNKRLANDRWGDSPLFGLEDKQRIYYQVLREQERE